MQQKVADEESSLLSKKICMVTGASGSIGKAVALRLAQSGASVLLVCRDQAKGNAVREDILSGTGNGSVEVLLCDLSSQGSIRDMVKTFSQAYQKLDVLLNTAAVFLNHKVETSDRLEMMFATNHLGPFLLTNLLIDSLKAAAPARVITVTAPSTTKLDFDDLQSATHFGALNTFGATKTANLLFTYELARRLKGSGVTANALHPGLVRSNLMHEAPFIIRWLAKLTSRSPKGAAEALMYLSSSPEVEDVTGRFFKGMKLSESSSYSRDPENQKRLWEISAALTGIENSQKLRGMGVVTTYSS